MHLEVRLLETEFWGKCGVFWYQFASDLEASNINFFMATYGESAPQAGKAECWNVVLTMVAVIWWKLRKAIIEAETPYGSEDQALMLGQYLQETFKLNRAMGSLLLSTFSQNPEMDLHITLYLFQDKAPRAELLSLQKKVEAKYNFTCHIYKTCKELISRVYQLSDKTNLLVKKQDNWKGTVSQIDTNNTTVIGSQMDDGDHTPEEVICVRTLKGRKLGI